MLMVYHLCRNKIRGTEPVSVDISKKAHKKSKPCVLRIFVWFNSVMDVRARCCYRDIYVACSFRSAACLSVSDQYLLSVLLL